MDTISRARPLETYHQDTAYDALLMAMAYHRLGESDEALAQLNAGREVIDRLQAADPSDRYLPALMAFSEEAEEVLSAVVGQNKP